MVRVLIVDDEVVLTFVLRQQLELRGCEVVGTAPNGKAAVDACRTLRPDVVLMDIRMPVMDGLEATQVIMEQCPTCVVMMTAYGAPDTAARAEAAGAMGYLTKPVGVEQVLEAVPPAQARLAEFEAIRAEAADLDEALDTRRLVEEAKRLLANGEGSAEGSFTALQQLAARLGVPLRAAATRILAEHGGPVQAP